MQSIDIAPQSTIFLSDVGFDHTLYAPSLFLESFYLFNNLPPYIVFLITMRARLLTRP